MGQFYRNIKSFLWQHLVHKNKKGNVTIQFAFRRPFVECRRGKTRPCEIGTERGRGDESILRREVCVYVGSQYNIYISICILKAR